MANLLMQELIRDEGLRLKPYRCTAGKWTIGVGRNLDDVGLDQEEVLGLLKNDIARVHAELDQSLPWWRGLSEPRRRALANMCFNLGITRLLVFKTMLSALAKGEFNRAADAAMASKWATQVGARAARIATMMREG